MPAQYPGNAITKAARAKVGGGFESAIEAPGGDLQLVAESGFTVTGEVADLAEVTISGQDFGTKPPVRHFDRIDRYWKNGTEVVGPYSGQADGDTVPNQSVQASSPFPDNGGGGDFAAWNLKQEAARRGRDFGYQLDSDPLGRMNGTTNAGFEGWPATQRDSEEFYMRFWHYQRYFGSEEAASLDMTLSAPLSTGATAAELVNGSSVIGSDTNDGLEEFYITLDTGELHYCQQTAPRLDNENFTFTPELPSPAAAGNPVYVRKETTMKLMRLRDEEGAGGGGYNCYALSGFRSEISNDRMSAEPGFLKGKWAPGVWQLHEIYIRAPKGSATDRDANYTKFVRIDGTVRMNIVGIANMREPTGTNGARQPPNTGFPSSGLGITNFGFEEDRDHNIPNNFVRYSDIYVDGQASGLGARRRIEIGIGNDDLYQCSNRECCPIKTWNGDITFNLNTLPFTEAEMAQARLFVVDADDVPTLFGRIQS